MSSNDSRELMSIKELREWFTERDDKAVVDLQCGPVRTARQNLRTRCRSGDGER